MTGIATDYERLFLESLRSVDRIVGSIARRHALSISEAEEFGAWAKAKLLDDAYGVFRKFCGRSSIDTYLTVVLANLYRDYRNARWGRWRPSAAAKRLGPLAIRLEELLFRDRLPLREAVSYLQSRDTSLDERMLSRLAASLPPHYPINEVAFEAAGDSDAIATAPPADHEASSRASELDRVIGLLMDELPAEDAVIVRMRYWNGLTVATIARTLLLDQKALYRRLNIIAARLRRSLEAHGINREIVAEVLAGEEA